MHCNMMISSKCSCHLPIRSSETSASTLIEFQAISRGNKAINMETLYHNILHLWLSKLSIGNVIYAVRDPRFKQISINWDKVRLNTPSMKSLTETSILE